MPDASGSVIEFRDANTKALMFKGKMHTTPRAGETVRYEGDDFTVSECGYIFSPSARIDYCEARLVVLLEPA